MDGDLAATYVMIYSFLVRQSQPKVAESLKKSLRGSLVLKEDLDTSGPSLDVVIKEWKVIKAAQQKLKSASTSDSDSDSSSSSSDSSASSSDSDSDAQKSAKGDESSSNDSSSSSSDSDSDSESDATTSKTKPEAKKKVAEVKVAQTKAANKTVIDTIPKKTKILAESSSTLKSSSGSSSSSSSESDSSSGSEADTEEDKKITVKETKKAVTFKRKKTKASPSDSSSSSDSDSDSESSSDDSSDSEAADRPTKKRKTTESGGAVVSATQTSTPSTEGTPQPKPGKPPRKANVPFRRINEEKVWAAGSPFQDNGYEKKAAPTNDYGAKAHQDLIVTRGAGFRKEKNKKKRGSYRGGEITMQVHSFKFED